MANPRASRLIRQALRTPQGRAIKTENRKNQPFKAVLGDGSNSDIRASAGMVWVRRVRGTDSSANSITSAPFTVRYSGFSSYIHKAGRVVWIQPGPDGELEISRGDWQDIVNSGNDPLALNFAHGSNRYLKLKNAVRAMWRPRDVTPKGTEVAFFGWLYYDNYGVLQAKGAGEAAVTYDLASLIPASGYQRYVVMFIRTSDNTAQAFGSTAQLLDDPLDLSDYAECLAQSIHNDDIPGQAFILSDAQTTIEMVDTDLGEDLRQFINQPTALGFPSTMNRNTLIREGQNVTVAGNVEVTTGNLIVEGTLAVHSHPPNITKTNIRVLEKLTANVFELDTPVWNDIFIGLSGAKVPAANAPTWATFVTPIKQYTFDVNDYFDLAAAEILHDYREGTDFDLHVHFVTNGVDGTDRGVKWQIEYTCANIGSVFPAVTTISAEATIAASTADRTHTYLDIGTVSGTGVTIGALIAIRITRITAVGTAPSSDPFGLMVGIHYEVNTLGSTTEAAK